MISTHTGTNDQEIGVQKALLEPGERQLIGIGQEEAEDQDHHQGRQVQLLAQGIHHHEDGEDEEELHRVLDAAQQPQQRQGEHGAEREHAEDLQAQ